jgi:hypothetical protein
LIVPKTGSRALRTKPLTRFAHVRRYDFSRIDSEHLIVFFDLLRLNRFQIGRDQISFMSEPDFYLVSSNGYGLEEPRSCWRIKRVIAGKRDDFLLTRVDPPAPIEFGRRHVDLVLLASKHVGFSLFPITNWPAAVYVFQPLVPDPESRDWFLKNEYYLTAWAELYRTEQEARR